MEQEEKRQYYKIDFAKLARLVFSDLDKKQTTVLFKNFPKERVIDALQSPQKHEKTLRDLSNFLFVVSSHYRRLCNDYAEMATLDWYIEPLKLDISKVDVKLFKKYYNDTLNELDNMNIKHEFLKILNILFREGIYYGYEHSTNESYFIQKLDADYCRISSVEDGVYNYQFNLQYFDKYPEYLGNYADEFRVKYNEYLNSKNKKDKSNKEPQWIEISAEKSICLKADETIVYPFPPFAGVFPELYEIQDYKSLKKASAEMDNYSVLVGSIPYNDSKTDSVNNFALDLDLGIEFGNKISESLPDQVGFLLSVFDKMELFKLNDDKVGTDKVEEAVNAFWSSAGVSKNLFADTGNTDAAMKYSVMADEQSVFAVLRQIERWINRKLKYGTRKYKFKINMMDITRFNRKDIATELLKACQFGLPLKTKLYVSMGGSQSAIESMSFLENDILKLHDRWIPLQSSHVQNGNLVNDIGRPSKDEEQNNGGDE